MVKVIFRFRVSGEDLSRLHTSFIAHCLFRLSIYLEVYTTHYAGAFIWRFTLLIMQGIYWEVYGKGDI